MDHSASDLSRAPGRTILADDRRLLERLRRDDRNAMAGLYDAYGRLAFSLANRVVGNPTEAEDVVQESFLTIWRQSQRVDLERGSLRAYLLTIVHRRAIDAVRRSSRRPERVLDPELSVAGSANDPVEFASMAQERDAIQRALRDLPEDQRAAVDLTYFGGLTIPEMAERESIPLGTAKSRLRLALGRLRKSLASQVL